MLKLRKLDVLSWPVQVSRKKNQEKAEMITGVSQVTSFHVEVLSSSRLNVVSQKKNYGKIKIKFMSIYSTLRLSAINIEIVISLEKG